MRATVTAGWWARLLLLVGTLLGLAAMHTLGHGSHAAGHSTDASHAAGRSAEFPARGVAVAGPHGGVSQAPLRQDASLHHETAAPLRQDAAAPLRQDAAAPLRQDAAIAYVVPAALAGVGGCPGDCPHERYLPFGGTGGELPWWGVCLAVLGALTAPLLLAVLLLVGVRAAGPAGRASGGPARSPRAPPPQPVGLRLATVSVLRR
ncbi:MULTISPECIES: hypothetical protein [unclassified Micromonospora]|uniref:hypothetical protein n=1 Tax=unclassified Micromonospora TaxID=2617518 RepID=UPI00331891C9